MLLSECMKGNKTQQWHESDQNELVLAKYLCLEVEDTGKGNIFVRMMKCHGSRGTQSWVWSIKVIITFHTYSLIFDWLKAQHISSCLPINITFGQV